MYTGKMTTINSLLAAIVEKHREEGITVSPAAKPAAIDAFEKRIGFALPEDFKAFYSCCNGFACEEDWFMMTELEDITRHTQNLGEHWFVFSEYLTYCDGWGLRYTDTGQYEIFNWSYPEITMTDSLVVFLERFLQGNVFDPGGLYDWQQELGIP